MPNGIAGRAGGAAAWDRLPAWPTPTTSRSSCSPGKPRRSDASCPKGRRSSTRTPISASTRTAARYSLEQHLADMARNNISRACVFALNEPDREPAYRRPNDRILRWAGEADGKLIPFVRLSLAEEPLAEAERCVDLGARGIKLHPRAQAFRVNDPRLEDVFAFAARAQASRS